MTTKIVKYWKRIGPDSYEPYATNTKERNQLMHYHDTRWCPDCEAVVEPIELIFNASGYVSACPFCESEV
jgi:hypothetical protein